MGLEPVKCGCGGETVIMPTPSGRFAVGCKKCDICTGLYNTEAEAVTAWNRAMGERTEIIHCRDCKFYTPMIRKLKTGICSLTPHHLGDDGFCSDAERRGEHE